MYGILRIQKYTKGSMRGIENHIERRAEKSNTNPDIKKERSKLNYDLTGLRDRTLNSLIKERLKKSNVEIKKKRKDIVYMVEMLFSATPAFFENMSTNEIRQYFQNCYEFVCNKYGKENVIAADVHLDEKTPHLHLELVPITKDNRLCAKELFNHQLEKLQDEVHEQVFSKYNLERGESHKDIKHISTLNYKALTLQAEIDRKKQELAELNNEQLFKMKEHINALSSRLAEMMSVIESDKDLMQEYLKARDEYFKNKQEEKEKYDR